MVYVIAPSLEGWNKREKEINEKRKWQTDNVHHPCEILIYSQGWPSLYYTLTSKKRRKKTLHLVQSHGRLVCLWMCECVSLCACVCVCVCAHLSACVYELFVSPPQALGCWVCSLKRLCFCCHLSLPLSVFLTQTLSTSVLSVRLYHSPSLFCPSVFHYRCFIIIVFKGQGKMLEECLIHSLSHPAWGMTLCYLRGKLVNAGSFENIIKLFMQ